MRSLLILFLVSVHVVVPEYYEVGGYLTKGKSLDLDNLSKTNIEGIAYRKVAALFDNCTLTINSFENSPTKDVINFQGVLVSSAPLTEEEKSILLNRQDTVKFFWIYKPLGSLEHTERVKSRMQSVQSNYCKNNGVLLADNTCDCRPYTSGTRCEQISCQHWGIPTNPNVIGPVDKRCHCPPGRYSEFCETRGCQPGIEENLSGGVRTLIIVISSIPQMAEERKYINDNINQTINTLKSREPGWIGNYLLMLTITTETAMATAKLPFESSEKLVDFLQTSDISSADYAFNQKIIFSIKDIQNYAGNMYPYSTVLVFANRPDGNGPPSISNTSITHEMAVVQQSLTWRSRIYFFITQTEEDPMNTSSYGYDTYRRVAANTHGELLLLNKSELPNVLQNFVTRLYKQEYLDAQSYIPCNTIQTKLVRDYAGQDVSVMITVDKNPGTPKNAIPYLVCDGNVINPDFHGKYWQLYSVPAGVSDLRVGSDDALICSYRVFVSSRSTLLTSFSGNKMVDVGDGMQSPQDSGFVMAQPDSFPIFTYSYMEILNATGQPSGEKYQSTLRSKSSCTAELLFEIPNPCTTGPFTQRHTFTVSATQQMQRVYPGYCADEIATTPPIPHPQPTIANISSLSCHSKNVFDIDRLHDFRHVFFLVETTSQMKDAVNRLANIIDNVTSQISADGNIRQFTLGFFNAKESDTLLYLSDYDAATFADDFKTAVQNTVFSDGSAVYSIQSIYQAVAAKILSPAIVNVFTSSTPLGYDNRYVWPTDVQVNFYYISETSISPADESFRLVQRQTGGRLMSIPSDSISTLGPILISSVYEPGVVLDAAQEECNKNVPFKFPIEYSANKFTITAKGESIAVTVVNDKGVNVESAGTLFKSSSSIVISVGNSSYNPAGTFQVFLSTSKGPCFLQVRTTSDIDLALGFTSDPSSDFPAKIPFSRRVSSLVGYVAVQYASDHVLSNLMTADEANLTHPWRDSTVQQQVPFLKRDEKACTYQYRTDITAMPNTEYIKVTVFGTDLYKTPYQRQFFYHTPSLQGDARMCNGGSYNKFGECVCPPNYSGEFCLQPTCVNGGTANTGVCDCLSGFGGTLCEKDFYGVVPTTTVTTTMLPTTTTTSEDGTSISLLHFIVGMIFILIN